MKYLKIYLISAIIFSLLVYMPAMIFAQTIASVTPPSANLTRYANVIANTSQVLGSDLLAGWDFTSGWTTGNSATINSATQFTAGADNSFIFSSPVMTLASRYKITITGTVSAGSLLIQSNATLYGTLSSPINSSVSFTCLNNQSIYLKVSANGAVVNITSMTIQPITQESGSLLMDVNALNKTISDKAGLRTITNTATTVSDNLLLPQLDGKVMDFNGTTSKLDAGTDFLGTTDLTYCGWIYPKTYGEGGAGSKRGRIVDNGKAIFRVTDQSAVGNTLGFSSDAVATNALAAANAVVLNSWNFVCATRTTNGTANLYIGTRNTAPVLSGTANQASGTPVAGNTNVIIGNNNAGDSTFDGQVAAIRVYSKILTTTEIRNLWLATPQSILQANTAGKGVLQANTLDKGLIAHYPLDRAPQQSATTFVDSTINMRIGTITAGASAGLAANQRGVAKSAYDFDGSATKITLSGSVNSISSVGFWAYLDNTSKDIIDFDGGTHSIEVSSGTLSATGFSSPAIYVDNIATTAISGSAWHYIVITTATPFNGTAIKIGNETTFFDGKISDVRVWNRVLTASEIKQLYNSTK